MPSGRLLLRLLLLLSTAPAPAARGDGDDGVPRGDTPPAPSERGTSPAPFPPAGLVRLAPARQRTGGLAVEPLEAASFRPETRGYGKVLDIQPLLELRIRHRTARAEAEIAAAALGLAEKNRRRLSELHRAEIVAGRDLAQAEAQWQSDRTKAEAARRQVDEIRREAEHAWGSELSRLALDGDSSLFDDLAAHRRRLLVVALPPGSPLPSGHAALFVARDHDRPHAAKAELISPAPGTDDLVQGETWFVHAAGEHLRAGMRVHAWAPSGRGERQGVVIPLSAVVWHAGRPWAYRRIGEDGFARTEIAGYRDHDGGWFVERGFAPGEDLVVTGAQMLLSEEFRGRIPDEDENDD